MIHAAEQDRPDVAARRTRWRVEQLHLDPKRLIFIDETWAKTNMTRLRGRAPRGERLIEKVPHGHWRTTTLIAALDVHGVRCSTTVDGAVNGEVFTAFVEHVLTPTLDRDEIVIMDNLSAHKVHGVREAIESVGASVVYLPPYSPDLNPIELAFSKLRQLMRSCKHRLVEPLWRDVQRMLDAISPTDALHFYQHCGYAIQEK
jgi:transposase